MLEVQQKFTPREGYRVLQTHPVSLCDPSDLGSHKCPKCNVKLCLGPQMQIRYTGVQENVHLQKLRDKQVAQVGLNTFFSVATYYTVFLRS